MNGFGNLKSINNMYMFFVSLQLHDFDMCIAKNEEALRIEPHFAECYGNMANAWKVILWIQLPGGSFIHSICYA